MKEAFFICRPMTFHEHMRLSPKARGSTEDMTDASKGEPVTDEKCQACEKNDAEQDHTCPFAEELSATDQGEAMKLTTAIEQAKKTLRPGWKLYATCAECGRSGWLDQWIHIDAWFDEVERNHWGEFPGLPCGRSGAAVCPACWAGEGGLYARKHLRPCTVTRHAPVGITWEQLGYWT